MNKEMEAETTKMDLTPGHLIDSEDECVDDAVTIHIRKERITKT